jgi:hypothetical protein
MLAQKEQQPLQSLQPKPSNLTRLILLLTLSDLRVAFFML